MSDYDKNFSPTTKPPAPRLTPKVITKLMGVLAVACVVLGVLLYLINEANI